MNIKIKRIGSANVEIDLMNLLPDLPDKILMKIAEECYDLIGTEPTFKNGTFNQLSKLLNNQADVMKMEYLVSVFNKYTQEQFEEKLK